MRNLDFLAKVLSSNNHYWIVSKQNDSTQGRMKDSIILMAIPNGVHFNIQREDIKLTDLEKLNASYMDQNIFLNQPYPPFQQGITFYNVNDGFPIDGEGLNVKEIMTRALSIKSDSLYEYKEQLKDLLTPYNKTTSFKPLYNLNFLL